MFSRNNYETNAYLECLDIIKSFFILKNFGLFVLPV
jgi:hypothetical protein